MSTCAGIKRTQLDYQAMIIINESEGGKMVDNAIRIKKEA
jgi:hypothetical protein